MNEMVFVTLFCCRLLRCVLTMVVSMCHVRLDFCIGYGVSLCQCLWCSLCCCMLFVVL